MKLGKLYQLYKAERLKVQLKKNLKAYLSGGGIPWSRGYLSYRNQYIENNIKNPDTLKSVKVGNLPKDYGMGLDERVVEYPWVFSQIEQGDKLVLDAGSTFNHDFILNSFDLANRDLTILTYAPESLNYNERRISYVYADLREIPFRENYFDLVVSMSTIEHIDMDNSVYGYDLSSTVANGAKSYEYLKAVVEMVRVLKPNGKLFITIPYGKFENHGFFQQFDSDMINRILDLISDFGVSRVKYFRYTNNQWEKSSKEECNNEISFNPHTDAGKRSDGAAHCRAIACLNFSKT